MLCDYGHAEILLTTSNQNRKRLRNKSNPTARSRPNSERVSLYAEVFIVMPTTTGRLNAPLFLQLKNEMRFLITESYVSTAQALTSLQNVEAIQIDKIVRNATTPQSARCSREVTIQTEC